MATTEEILVSLAQTIGLDISNQLNLIRANIANTTSVDDTAVSTVKTYSSEKIVSLISGLKGEILGGASAAFDTLKELADAIQTGSVDLSTVLAALGNRLRFDASQDLTGAQKLQAWANLGMGNMAVDLVAVYRTARGI